MLLKQDFVAVNPTCSSDIFVFIIFSIMFFIALLITRRQNL